MRLNGLAQHVFEAERRRADRDDVFLRTILRLDDGAAIPIELVNISRVGFMARTHVPMAPDMRVRIVVPAAGEFVSRVVWALGGRIGCEFTSPIDAASYFELIAALPRQ